MKRLTRAALVALALIIVISVAPVFGMVVSAAVVGNALYRAGSSVVGRIAGRETKERNPLLSRGRRTGKSSSVVYDRKTGWNMLRFPEDVSLDTTRGDGRSVLMTCAGIDGLVSARAGRDGTAEFSFRVPERGARRAMERGQSLRQSMFDISKIDADGTYLVKTGDPKIISELANAAFPKKEMEVTRTVEHVRQYLVGGCASYEEALEKFADERDGMTSVSSFYRTVTEAGGVRVGSSLSGSEYSPAALAVGEFIVNVLESETLTGKVSVPTDAPGGEENMAARCFNPSGNDVTRSEQPEQLLDGTPEGVTRSIRDAEGKEIVLHESEDADSANHLRAFCIVPEEGRDELMQHMMLPEGTVFMIGRDEPVVDDGRMVISTYVNPGFLDSVSFVNDSDRELAERYDGFVPTQDIILSRSVDAAENSGHVLVQADHMIDACYAGIGGITLDEYVSRKNDSHLPALDDEQMKAWTADAAKIDFVTVTVDSESQTMTVASSVQGIHKRETYKLTEGETEELCRRGSLSSAERMDFLMQTHPDFFRTYSGAKGMKSPDSPLESLVTGRRPEQGTSEKRKPEVKRPAAPKVKAKRNAGMKI